MSWSTSKLAKIAGTTVKTIRYYHRIGVLPEPERASNGYKQYQVEHLITLLRILRLKELGLPVRDVDRLTGDGADAWESLRILDAELKDRIEKWTAVRAELATLLKDPEQKEPFVDLPPGMLGLSNSLNDSDRAILLVYSQLFDQQSMESIAESLRDRTKNPAERAFDALPPNAHETTKRELAEKLMSRFAEATGAKGNQLPVPGISKDAETAANVLGTTLDQIYNPAQIDVLRRISAMTAAASTSESPRLPRRA